MIQDPRKLPLTAEVYGGKLVITIGVDTLAFAYTRRPDGYDEDGRVKERITDNDVFAEEVVSQMHTEKEDGSTVLSDFIDKAAEDAVNDGSVAWEEIPVADRVLP